MKLSVFIGRFQPFHLGHAAVVAKALSISDCLLMINGTSSDKSVENERYRWNHAENFVMYSNSIPCRFHQRISFVELQDQETDEIWCRIVRRYVKTFATDEVVLVGADRDPSTYYLKLFPEWQFVDCNDPTFDVSGTMIRAALDKSDWLTVKAAVHPAVFAYLYDTRRIEQK